MINFHVQIDANRDVYCAGGVQPPKNCDEHMVSSTDFSRCVCTPGYWWTGSINPTTHLYTPGGYCAICDAGYYCIDGNKNRCPPHHYQESIGSSACKSCTVTGDEYGTPMIDCGYSNYNRNALKQCIDLPSQSVSLDNNCIPCSRCIPLNGDPAYGRYPCYNY